MMKYILAATVLVYIVLIFIPKMKITVNGQPSDNFSTAFLVRRFWL